MKKYLALLLAAVLLLALAACGQTAAPAADATATPEITAAPTSAAEEEPAAADPVTDKLTIYTTVSDTTVETIVSEFEAQTGIEVELVTGGVGELLKRVESERENPLGDVVWGAALSSIQAYDPTLFYSYVTENNDSINSQYQIADGTYTVYGVAMRCLLVNTNLAEGIEITGYDSLLQDELKGKIAMVDPSASSSGFGQLSNMLFDMGTDNDPDSDAAWDYVTAFCEALDGKLLNSSSAVWKGVCDGEYTVGLTYEEVSLQAVKDGYPVKIVYCEEGAFGEATTAAIISGAENLGNAKAFLNFLTSYDVQATLSSDLCLRGVRTDLPFSDTFVNIDDIALANVDPSTASAMKSQWLDKFMDIWTSVAA